MAMRATSPRVMCCHAAAPLLLRQMALHRMDTNRQIVLKHFKVSLFCIVHFHHTSFSRSASVQLCHGDVYPLLFPSLTLPAPADLTRLQALFDYDAASEEELSFPEGAIIELMRKDDNGVDDGWWEGRYQGKVGVFPSIVVEVLERDLTDGQDVSGCVCFAR